MSERARLEQAIFNIENQRAVLGDETVDETITALQEKLAALEPKLPEEQRRPVTVLFADMVGFTAMSEAMDPEEVQEIQDHYFEAVTQPITSYGGSIEKYIGDAVVAVFGVPHAHEDDTERAVRASLAMQEAIEDLNSRLLIKHDLRLSIRVGVHSGLVVSRVVDESDFVITGDTVNLASRIQSAAEPGTVLMSEQAYKSGSGIFETISKRSIQVKGKAQPVIVYQVVAVPDKSRRPRGIPGLDSPLVGRQDEQVILAALVDKLSAGRGGIVTIIGDAGIGKSRIVAELRKSIVTKDLRWTEGRCFSYSGSTSFSLWLEIIRDILEVREDDDWVKVQEKLWQRLNRLCPDRLDQVYPYIAHLLDLPLEKEFQARIINRDNEELKNSTFEAISILLFSLTTLRPLVLVCEDLHWADPSSLELLEQITGLTANHQLLIVCVLRKVPDHDSWKFKEKTAGQNVGHYTELSLHPLTTDGTEELITNLLSGQLPPELKARILDRAEGNPFYVEEILHSLIDSSIVDQDVNTGDWTVKREISEIPLPNTLQGVILTRMDHLSIDAKRILQTASVIGRRFGFRLLEKITSFQSDNLTEILSVLESRQYIRVTDGEHIREFTFKHVLTQEVAYQALLKRHRRDLHLKIGEAIEELYGEALKDYIELLSYHFLSAEVWQKAWSYHLQSANKAISRFANKEAIAFLKKALEIADHLPNLKSGEVAGIHVQMGAVLSSINQYDQALDALEHGLRVALDEQPPESRALLSARIYRKIGQVLRSKGEYTQSAEAIQKGIDVLDGSHPKDLGALQIAMASTLTRLAKYEKAQFYCELGIEAAEAGGDFEELAHGYTLLGTIRRDMGDTAASLSYRQMSLEISQNIDHIPLQMEAHNNLAVAYYDLGQLDEAVAHYKESRTLSERIGNLNTVARAEINLGEVHLIQGDWSAAESAFRQSLAIWEDKGYLLGQAYGSSNMGAVLTRRGKTDEALAYLQRSEELFTEMGARSFLPAVYRRIAGVHLARGDSELALEYGLKSLNLARELSMGQEEGAALRELGRIHQEEGEFEIAIKYLEKSLVIFEEAGIPYEEARSLVELARTWLKIGDLDRERIKAALDAAAARFTSLGAAYDLAQAELLISELPP